MKPIDSGEINVSMLEHLIRTFSLCFRCIRDPYADIFSTAAASWSRSRRYFGFVSYIFELSIERIWAFRSQCDKFNSGSMHLGYIASEHRLQYEMSHPLLVHEITAHKTTEAAENTESQHDYITENMNISLVINELEPRYKPRSAKIGTHLQQNVQFQIV